MCLFIVEGMRPRVGGRGASGEEVVFPRVHVFSGKQDVNVRCLFDFVNYAAVRGSRVPGFRGTLYFTFAPLSIVKNQEDYIVLLSRLAEGLSLSLITDFPTLGSRSLYPHCHTFAPKFFISPCGTITRFPPGPSSRATATYIKLLRSS